MPVKKVIDGATAVHDGVLKAISLQRLAPGTRLPEENLARIFAVGRGPVRSALARLKQRGLVRMEPNRSAEIATYSVAEVHGLFDVRRWIEPEVAADVAHILTPSQLTHLKSHLDDEQAARDAGDRIEATRLSGLFHTELARCSPNMIARRYISELVDQSFLAIYLYQRVGVFMCVNEDHLDLIATLESGDPDRARRSMRDHLDHILERLDLSEKGEENEDLEQAFAGVIQTPGS